MPKIKNPELTSEVAEISNSLAESFIQESEEKNKRNERVDSLLDKLEEKNIEKEKLVDKVIKLDVEISESSKKNIESLKNLHGSPTETKATQDNTPVSNSKIQRDSAGLIFGLNYEFDDLGFVNYKKLIPREFLVPNRQYFKDKKMSVPDSIDGLADRELIVLLTGYKTLAAIRGFRSVKHKIVSATDQSVMVETKITWLGNYETDFQEVTYTALATASLNNTFNFAKNYLAEIAQNRGECRAIRGFLRIPILAHDELGPQNEEDKNNSADTQTDSNPLGPVATLQKKMNEKNIDFEKIKISSINKKNLDGSPKFTGAENWKSLSDIPKNYVVDILAGFAEKEKKELK